MHFNYMLGLSPILGSSLHPRPSSVFLRDLAMLPSVHLICFVQLVCCILGCLLK